MSIADLGVCPGSRQRERLRVNTEYINIQFGPLPVPHKLKYLRLTPWNERTNASSFIFAADRSPAIKISTSDPDAPGPPALIWTHARVDRFGESLRSGENRKFLIVLQQRVGEETFRHCNETVWRSCARNARHPRNFI